MRKLTLLALAALVAGTVHAETRSGFSGSFEFYNTWDIRDKKHKAGDEGFVIGADYSTSINLGGVIDEWTTVSSSIKKDSFKIAERVIMVKGSDGNPKTGADDLVAIGDTIVTDLDEYEIENDGDDKFGAKVADLIDSNNSANVYDTDEYDSFMLEEFTMTHNLTGALGFADSPVGVSLTWGKTSLTAAGFHKVAGIGYLDPYPTDSYYGLKLDVTFVEKVKVITAIYPETYLKKTLIKDDDKYPAGAIDLQMLDLFGLVEGLNINIYFTLDPNKDTDEDTAFTDRSNEFGITAGYSGEKFSAGLAMRYDLFHKKFGMGVSASTSFLEKRLNAGLAYVIENFAYDKVIRVEHDEDNPAGKRVTQTDDGFEKTPFKSLIEVDLRGKVILDVLDIVFAMEIPLTSEKDKPKEVRRNSGEIIKDDMEIDAGIEVFLGSVTYGLGYEYNDRNKYSPNGDDSTGLYFKVKASF